MATIDDLRKSITEMSDDELFNLHREVRQSRRTSKRVDELFNLHREVRQSRRTSKRVTKPTKKTKKEINMVEMVKGMSEEDRRQLLKELEEM